MKINKKKIFEFPYSVQFWSFILASSIAAECIGLFFQYVMKEDPCAICVHIRAWIMLIGIISIAAILLKKHGRLPVFILYTSLMFIITKIITLADEALKIERGTVFSTCSIEAGFPSWLPLDRLIPFVFEPTGICGKVVKIIPDLDASPSLSEIIFYGSVSALFFVSFVILISSVVEIVFNKKKSF